MNDCLAPFESSPIVWDSRGRLYLSHDDLIYRLRFWAEQEWLDLPADFRPVALTYSAALACWVGLEPAPQMNKSRLAR
jgi:hypothetical protein